MTYRVGRHHGVTIVDENPNVRCLDEDHDCARGHLVAVVVDGDQALAERICALLNGDGCTRVGLHNCAGEWRNHDHEIRYACPDHPGPLDDARNHVCRPRPARDERTTP